MLTGKANKPTLEVYSLSKLTTPSTETIPRYSVVYIISIILLLRIIIFYIISYDILYFSILKYALILYWYYYCPLNETIPWYVVHLNSVK